MRNSSIFSRALGGAACACLVIGVGLPAHASQLPSAKPAVPSFVLPDLSDSGGSLPLPNGASAIPADFDEDGSQDVLVPNADAPGVVVLLGDGVGGLGAPVLTPLPSDGSVIAAAAGDLDGDSHVDAVAGTLDATSGLMRVLLGNGDGTFTVGQRIDSGDGGRAVEVQLGDLNGDGKLDLAALVQATSGETIWVATGKGDGTFGEPTIYAPGSFTAITDMDIADVDGDGDLDLVYLQGCPTVRLNKGNGTFGNEICSAGGLQNTVVEVVADFDGDGLPDIAIGDASGGHVYIGRGDGKGRFTLRSLYIQGLITSLVSGDFTGDGVIDIVASADVAYSAVPRVITLLVGRGDATFARSASWATGGGGLTAVDLDGDGLPDLVSAGFDTSSISATLNTGGDFRAPRVYTSSQGVGRIVRTADINGDGRADVVTATRDGVVNVFLQKKDGTLQTPPLASAGSSGIQSLALGDVNKDGKLDVVAGSAPNNNLFVMLGKGDGRFGTATTYNNGGTATVLGLALGDVNGDGDLDIVSNTPAALSVLLGKGDGTFGAAKLSGTGATTQVATVLGDITGDGKIDAVAVIKTGDADHASSRVVVNNGKGDGTFTTGQQLTVDANANVAIGIATGSGGKPGVALVGIGGAFSGRTGLYVLANSGGKLTKPTYLGGPGSDLTSADLNGDKKVDIATIGRDQLSIFTSSRSGAFTAATSFAAGQSSPAIAAGDLTGTSRTDLVELDYSDPQQLTVYENNTAKP